MDQYAFVTMIGLAFLLAGTVKGAVGIGLPTAAIGLTTLIVDPRTAIAYTMAPMIAANAWQVYRQGETLDALRRYAPFGVMLALFVAVTVIATRSAPDRLLLGVLGGTILVFVAMNVTQWAPRLSAAQDRPAQVTSGAIAGVMGGLVGVWAPPMVFYLTARATPKEEFVRATGLLILIGSVPLALGYAWNGHMAGEAGLLSLALMGPTFLGFALGERLRRHLSETGFKRLLLFIFLIMGLNLIRRALV